MRWGKSGVGCNNNKLGSSVTLSSPIFQEESKQNWLLLHICTYYKCIQVSRALPRKHPSHRDTKSRIEVIDGSFSYLSLLTLHLPLSLFPSYLQQSSNETHMPVSHRHCELLNRKITLMLGFPSTPHASFPLSCWCARETAGWGGAEREEPPHRHRSPHPANGIITQSQLFKYIDAL